MGHSTGSTVATEKERMTTAPSGLGRRRQNFEAQAKVNRRFRGVGSLCPKHWLMTLIAKGLVPTRATTAPVKGWTSRIQVPPDLITFILPVLNLKERPTLWGARIF